MDDKIKTLAKEIEISNKRTEILKKRKEMSFLILKGSIAVFAVILAVLLFKGIFSVVNYQKYKQINALIIENEAKLTEISIDCLKSGLPPENIVNDINYSYSVGDEKNGTVRYFIAADKKMPSSTEYGFYYSANDEPAAYGGYEPYKINDEIWEVSFGGNIYITSRIKEHWFYYQATY